MFNPVGNKNRDSDRFMSLAYETKQAFASHNNVSKHPTRWNGRKTLVSSRDTIFNTRNQILEVMD